MMWTFVKLVWLYSLDVLSEIFKYRYTACIPSCLDYEGVNACVYLLFLFGRVNTMCNFSTVLSRKNAPFFCKPALATSVGGALSQNLS